jgi:hypothetical protein
VYKVVVVKYEKKQPEIPRHKWENIIKKGLKKQDRMRIVTSVLNTVMIQRVS